MSRVLRVAIAFTLVFAIVAGSLLSAGCGGGKKAALVLPTIELFQFAKGAAVDFDEATINSMATAEAGIKYGTAKAIYHSVWAANQEAVANALFPPPYWKGDGVTTKYAMLASGDQSAVDATIFATKLTQAEQDQVTNAVAGLFTGYDEELAAAKPLEQNTAYTILYYSISADAANAWKADATAWMAALNAKAAADYAGKTFAQLTYAQRQTVMAAVFNNGAGTINPEYAFWRAMVQDSFRNGNASARWPDLRDSKVPAGKTYATLNCIEKATVDATVWATCNQTAVNDQITGMWDLATEQRSATVVSDNQNVYYLALKYGIPSIYTTDNNSDTAAAAWLATVSPTAPGTTENTTFYAHVLGGQATWKTMLTHQYFGTDNYTALSTDAKALIDQADSGMMSLSVAQRSTAMPLTSNVVYQTLQYKVGSVAAAEGWKTEVTTGIDQKLALYKWMAYEGFRNGTVATFYPTQVAAKLASLFPGRTSASLDSCEKGQLNGAVFAALDVYEQGFGGSVVSGLWGKVQAEMTDAIDMTETSLIRGPTGLKAATGTETSVINWKKDITTGGLTVSASYYRWMAKEAVIPMKAMGTLIRLSEAEFLFKVTNTNKYPVVISNASYNFYINSTATSTTAVKVDTAKVVAGDDIWVPAESDLLVSVRAPVKQMGIITWMVMAGQSTPNAQKLAADVWSQYLTATASTWIIQIDVKVTNEKGDDVQVHTFNIPAS
jgi:LEA14-like dessication related protein